MTIEMLRMVHMVANVLTVPVSILVTALYAPKYGYSRKKASTYAAVNITIIVLFSYAFYFVLRWFGILDGLNSYRTYLIIPLFTYVLSEDWKIPALHGADFMMPALLIVRAMVLIACNLLGCSFAVPCDWGIYSPTLGCNVFPMDMIDLIATTLIAIFSFWYARKLNYKGEGRIYAMCMGLLGIVRMFNQLACTEVWVRGVNDETVYSLIAFATAIYIFCRHKKKQMEDKL